MPKTKVELLPTFYFDSDDGVEAVVDSTSLYIRKRSCGLRSSMTDERLLAEVDDLRRLPAETPWAEFKEANADPQRIGELISGIANSARLADRDFGYVVWGVRDRDHAVTATSFEPSVAKSGNERLEIWPHAW